MTHFKPHPTVIDLDTYPSDFSPCHRRVLSARCINAQQLQKPLSQLYRVTQLAQAKCAAERLNHAIQNQEKIVIVGDYDADGATALALLVWVLRRLGGHVGMVVPNRVTMGYGLSDKAVDAVLRQQAQLVVTVDNGINAIDSVKRLKANHVDVIITDHHLPSTTLPPADQIVNPNVCDFPSKALSGVGVAFYLVLALREVYRENQQAFDNISVVDLLPLVAIGTIADVVPMDFNNRILVEHGLKRIRSGCIFPGIAALIEVCGLSRASLSAVEVGFQLAPRLNAAGRIADMQLGVDCLLSSNQRLAMDYALALDDLNRQRKSLENEMRISADALLSKSADDHQGVSLCLFDPAWEEGLVGILASRLKDKYQKTAFVFTRAQHSGQSLLKASARAGQSVNVIAALNHVDQQNPGLLISFGGHAKAAGLVLAEHDFPQFVDAIESAIASQLNKVVLDSAIYTDGELLPYEMNLANAAFLKTLEPWGNQLPEPLFENTFHIIDVKEVGQRYAKLQMAEENSGQVFKAIAFDKYAYYDSLKQQRCRVAYRLSVDEWRGQQSLSLIVTHAKRCSSL